VTPGDNAPYGQSGGTRPLSAKLELLVDLATVWLKRELARRPPRKPQYVTVSPAQQAARWNAWGELVMADPELRGLSSNRAKTRFAHEEHISVREFGRWFQLHNSHAPGSAKETEYLAAIARRLGRLKGPMVVKTPA
jgi:hypothetical protein